ncbi:MAG: class I SAM-dependent methyltransferase [Blastocatellia bacterium]|nr:class I SAM-dependent methyltransferase [Blastocatellia bacterium]
MTSPMPSPEQIFVTLNAFHQSAALKGAIDLDLFTAIAEGKTTPPALAEACQASERGVHILCDYLTIQGFLTKMGAEYGLPQNSAVFLNRHSPAYLGGMAEFLLAPMMTEIYRDVAATVRKGGTIAEDGEGSVSPENPVWVAFARGMMPMMMPAAQQMAEIARFDADRKIRVLDIAAGHGIFGITFAQKNPNVEVTALDWAPVLEVARENAEKFGVADRYHLRPGSAFEVDFGGGWDLILLTNFLHHFDAPTNEALLRRVHAALNDGGRALTLEFVPNDDRITPPGAGAFAMVMLASTRGGDAYTFAEYQQMFANAGFAHNEIHPMAPMPNSVIVSTK